jgi:hypothetical protein
MKTSIIILLLMLCETTKIFAQFDNLSNVPSDSIFNLGNHQFRHKGLTFDTPRALKRALNLDRNSELYKSAREYSRTRRWAYVFEILGIGSIGASVDDFSVLNEGEVRPVPLILGLASVGAGLMFWGKANRKFNNFIDDYNHQVYDKYIQDRFMKPNLTSTSQINVGFKIDF